MLDLGLTMSGPNKADPFTQVTLGSQELESFSYSARPSSNMSDVSVQQLSKKIYIFKVLPAVIADLY